MRLEKFHFLGWERIWRMNSSLSEFSCCWDIVDSDINPCCFEMGLERKVRGYRQSSSGDCRELFGIIFTKKSSQKHTTPCRVERTLLLYAWFHLSAVASSLVVCLLSISLNHFLISQSYLEEFADAQALFYDVLGPAVICLAQRYGKKLESSRHKYVSYATALWVG